MSQSDSRGRSEMRASTELALVLALFLTVGVAKRPLGFYVLVADDADKIYNSNKIWTPELVCIYDFTAPAQPL